MPEMLQYSVAKATEGDEMICENCTIVELAAARYRTQAKRPSVTLAVQLCPLHAAAPDLLTALERMTPDYEHCAPDMGGNIEPDRIALIKQARDAIARAKETT